MKARYLLIGIQDFAKNRWKNYIKSNSDIPTSGIALASYITTIVFTVVGMEKIPLFAKITG